MPKPRRKLRVNQGYEELPQIRLSPAVKRGILIVVFLLFAVISFMSFFGLAGSTGKFAGMVMSFIFGWGAVVTPLFFFSIAVALFLAGRRTEDGEPRSTNGRVYLGATLLIFSLTGVLQMLAMHNQGRDQVVEIVKQGQGGGYLGLLTAYPLYALLDFWISIIILFALLFISLIVLLNINLVALMRRSMAEKERPMKKMSVADVKINKMQTSGFNVSEVADNGSVAFEEEPSDKQEKKSPAIAKTFAKEHPQSQMDFEAVRPKFKKSNWQLPPITFLEDSHTVVDSGNIEANVSIIERTLADFGIEVEMGEVNVGPTVTQYTLRPAQGIKLSQIVALQNDLALALAASSIRVEAPIPGRPLVGIEIPNKSSAIVRVKDVIQSEDFIKHKSNLAFALGRDVAGKPMVSDLARMPHLLIAGATGTGKSIGINSLLISFLYRNSPEELRLIIIDPKRVELNLYNGIPHLLTPVVTDYEKAVNALKWAVREMDRRYKLLAEASKRNIVEYNAKAPEPLPYIVVVVDELADLMAVAQADVEAAVVRLAQMARAVGVHLVVATQRPSVDIITGLIKANITARMAFAVASQVDSRTILDMSGAEKLLGKGDMLFITSDLGKPKRVQGTYISEKEVRGVVEFISRQAGEVEYSEEILEKPLRSGLAGGFSDDQTDDSDPMLPEAITVVKQAGKASASLLQRRLRLGYARAARLLDLMEEKGIIGPGDGAKPRDVYMTEGEEEAEYEEEQQ